MVTTGIYPFLYVMQACLDSILLFFTLPNPILPTAPPFLTHRNFIQIILNLTSQNQSAKDDEMEILRGHFLTFFFPSLAQQGRRTEHG